MVVTEEIVAPVITAFVPANNAIFYETDIVNIDVGGQVLGYTIKIDRVNCSTSSSYV